MTHMRIIIIENYDMNFWHKIKIFLLDTLLQYNTSKMQNKQKSKKIRKLKKNFKLLFELK